MYQLSDEREPREISDFSHGKQNDNNNKPSLLDTYWLHKALNVPIDVLKVNIVSWNDD